MQRNLDDMEVLWQHDERRLRRLRGDLQQSHSEVMRAPASTMRDYVEQAITLWLRRMPDWSVGCDVEADIEQGQALLEQARQLVRSW